MQKKEIISLRPGPQKPISVVSYQFPWPSDAFKVTGVQESQNVYDYSGLIWHAVGGF